MPWTSQLMIIATKEELEELLKLSLDLPEGARRKGLQAVQKALEQYDTDAANRLSRGAADPAALFGYIFQAIDNRAPDAGVDKGLLRAAVWSIVRENRNGEQAKVALVEGSLKTLALMAKDIFDVTVAALVSPGAAVATVVKEAAEKAKREEGG